MKSRPQAISTARGVALIRAMEMLRPEAERISSDPFAASFVNPVMLQLTRLSVATGISARIGIEGMINFALVREAHTEALMRREIERGLGQIVILGAGFDTRAYRLSRPDGIAIFEVDHPITQASKRKALAQRNVELPAAHHFVSVDFDIDDLGQRLAVAGYDSSRRTLFVWQGVIMYLTAAGIDATLAFIAGHAPAGSTLIVDFTSRDWLREGETGALRMMTRAMGEAIRFAVDEAELAPFLEHRGFTSVEIIDAAALKAIYLTGANARRPMASGVFIATARIG